MRATRARPILSNVMTLAVLSAVLVSLVMIVATARHCRPQLRAALRVLEDARR